MPQRARHSRQKSDDFKETFGTAESFEISESLLGQHSLSFLQPKCSFLTGVRLLWKQFQHFLWLPLLFFTTRTIPSIVLLVSAILIPVILAAVTITWFLPEVDMSLSSFQIPDHVASRHQDAFDVAKFTSYTWKKGTMKRKRRSADPEPWPDAAGKTSSSYTAEKSEEDYTLSKRKWTIDLVYMARGKGEHNMFTKERLKIVHRLEQSILSYKGIQDLCWKWKVAKMDPILVEKYNACTPPISLIDFFFPSPAFYDGQGDDSKLTGRSINKTLTFLLSKPFTYWFVDGNFSVNNKKSTFLRAQVNFGYPLKGYSHKIQRGKAYEEQRSIFVAFMKKFIVYLKEQSTDEVSILYGGPQVYDYLVSSTLWNDVNLAKFTLILIVILMFILTSCSLFLMFFGMLSILASLPLAFFAFCVIFKISTVTILSGVSLFIIIGIGVDDVFVFINTFLHAKGAKDMRTRMKHTISTAAGATFFTSFTTAAAFGANCLSKMPAIHDFGLFMLLIVICCWLSVVLIIPPVLFLWDRYVARLEAKLCNVIFKWLPCRSTTSPQLPEDIQHFLSGNQGDPHGDPQCPSHMTTEDMESTTAFNEVTLSREQVPPPEIEEEPSDAADDADDSDMLCLSDDANEDADSAPLLANSSCSNPASSRHAAASWGCINRLQFGLFYLTKCVYSGRYILLVTYLLLLTGSTYLDTKITPSSKPPAFFKESSNLQQLLNLKYNLSGDNYDCKICGDVLKDAGNFINGMGRPTTSPINSNTLPNPPPTEGNSNGLPSLDLTTRPPTTTARAQASGGRSQHPTTRPSRVSRVIGSLTRRPKSASPLTTKKPTTATPHPTTPQTPNTTTTTPSTTTVMPSTTATRRQPTTFDSHGNGINDSPGTTVGPTFDDPCPTPDDCAVADRPILDSTAMVYVVIGIKDIDRSHVKKNHVLAGKGNVVMDPKFTKFIMDHRSQFVKHMCRICTAFAQNKELVREAGADCFPKWLTSLIVHSTRYSMYEECRHVRSHTGLNGESRARMFYKKARPGYRNSTYLYWIAMAFETTLHKGSSSREAHQQYMKWDTFLKEQVKDYEELQSAFHTSEAWVHMFMEIIAVNGAIYGIVFSLIMCMAAVVIFTGHFVLSIIVMLTILGVLCAVVAIFYLVGWHIGAVEAISLSILVGTSVDYCVHLVDGYILSGRFLPNSQLSGKDLRGWRTSAAISHIGSSILSSAITTIVAAIPLCFTTIQLFAKFGQILAINTAVSIFYTLTFCIALLTIMAPARFRRTIKSRLIALLGVSVFGGMATLILYIVSLKGIPIQGPDGSPLFDV